jgi:hypothetical protein
MQLPICTVQYDIGHTTSYWVEVYTLFHHAPRTSSFPPSRSAGMGPKVGEVPTFLASDTDTDLLIVSTSLFNGFQYLKNRFIASNEDL